MVPGVEGAEVRLKGDDSMLCGYLCKGPNVVCTSYLKTLAIRFTELALFLLWIFLLDLTLKRDGKYGQVSSVVLPRTM